MPGEGCFNYSAFGLCLRSNLPIPGLSPIETPELLPDVEIHLGAPPPVEKETTPPAEHEVFVSPHEAVSGEPIFRVWRTEASAFLRLDYFDGVRFWLDGGLNAVWATWPRNLSVEDAAAYLLGPAIGLLLRLRGVSCLHASAVAIGDLAVAFAGPEGAGKSTTAAALARRGHPVVADDIVALSERDDVFFASPACPYLALWSESVTMLYGPDKTLPSFSADFEKRQLFLAENQLQFVAQPLQLGGVFILGERSADAAAPFAEPLTPREGLVSLITNTYATKLLDLDKALRAREFKFLGRLLSGVPVWRLRPHEDGSRVEQLCALIEDSWEKMQVISSAARA